MVCDEILLNCDFVTLKMTKANITICAVNIHNYVNTHAIIGNAFSCHLYNVYVMHACIRITIALTVVFKHHFKLNAIKFFQTCVPEPIIGTNSPRIHQNFPIITSNLHLVIGKIVIRRRSIVSGKKNMADLFTRNALWVKRAIFS